MERALMLTSDSPTTQVHARRGLAIYFAVLVPLTALFSALMLRTGNGLWVLPLMWSPAAASVVARLLLRDGFTDVSFRLGGPRTWRFIGLALLFPTVFGLLVYGIAWTTGLVQFQPPPPAGLVAQLAGDSASPVARFVIMLLVASSIGTLLNMLYAGGEELGWRGYMLTRLVESGVPRPVLLSGVIWGAWHLPVVLGGAYLGGLSPVLSVVLVIVSATLIGFMHAWVRLETGSVWPTVVLHASWNTIIQQVFDLSTTGADAAVWVGEAGIVTMLAMLGAVMLITRRPWAMRRVPDETAAG